MIEVVVEFTANARAEFDLRGTVLRVTLDVFGASSMTVSAEEVAAPTWLPGPESNAEFPERRLDIWTVLDEGTITEHLRAEITWLRSLSRAIERGYTARALQIVSSNPESLGERLSRPPLHLAVIREDRGMVESFLSHGADIATIDGSDRTALHYAAGRGNIELTALLVERGAPLEAKDGAGFTPIRSALAENQMEVADLLEKRGARLDANCLLRLGRFDDIRANLEKGTTILQEASEPWTLWHCLVEYLRNADDLDSAVTEALPVVGMLLDQGLDPNEGFPLYEVVRLPDTRLARLLLERGANPNAGAESGHYLMPTPASGMAMRQLLHRHGAKSSEDPDVVFPNANATLEYEPEDTEALCTRARAWWQTGQYQQAQEDLTALLEIDSEHPQGRCLQGWIWAACPDDNLRDGAQALDLALELQSTFLVGLAFESDVSGESWSITEHQELQAAALAEQGEFEQALGILDDLGKENAGWEERERMLKMRACFEAQQPFRSGPISPEMEEYGQQQAELAELSNNAVIVDETEDSDVDEQVSQVETWAGAGREQLPIDAKGELRLIGCRSGLEQFQSLVEDPRFGELTALRILGGELPDEVALLIAERLRPPRLSCLELARAYFGDRVGIALAQVMDWPALTELILKDNRLTRRTAEAIAANPSFIRLKKLDLASNHVRTRGMRSGRVAPPCWSRRTQPFLEPDP